MLLPNRHFLLSAKMDKLTLFAVSKDEWDTKEDTGKYMKNALHILRYAKRRAPLGPKQRHTVKQN